MQPAFSEPIGRASDLAGARDLAGTPLASTRGMLPVEGALLPVLPGAGLRRGSVVGVSGTASGTTSLLFALLAQASKTGSWCALVGMPQAGFVAAAETGIALDRLAVVPNPGPDWPNVVAALIDGFDLVVIGMHRIGGRIAAPVCAQIAARVRRRGSVLVPFGPGRDDAGWHGAEVTLSLAAGEWIGVGEGAGRRVTIASRGRGAASIPRRMQTWLPKPANLPAPAVLLAALPEPEAPRLRIVR